MSFFKKLQIIFIVSFVPLLVAEASIVRLLTDDKFLDYIGLGAITGAMGYMEIEHVTLGGILIVLGAFFPVTKGTIIFKEGLRYLVILSGIVVITLSFLDANETYDKEETSKQKVEFDWRKKILGKVNDCIDNRSGNALERVLGCVPKSDLVYPNYQKSQEGYGRRQGMYENMSLIRSILRCDSLDANIIMFCAFEGSKWESEIQQTIHVDTIKMKNH